MLQISGGILGRNWGCDKEQLKVVKMAGLIVVYNKYLRDRLRKQSSLSH